MSLTRKMISPALHVVVFALFLLNTESKNDDKKFKRPSAKFDNPNYIRDRYKLEIWKPMMNESWVKRFHKPFNLAWMDYCDPYHCNDYHKRACGLNRQNMRFKWFQSACHMILNNKCAKYRGNLKYDWINSTYCNTYVMNLRSRCPTECSDFVRPVCTVSLVNNHIVLFKNRCAFEKKNCEGFFDEYEEINPYICKYVI